MSTQGIDALVAEAVQLQKSGQTQAAAVLYQAVLKENPGHPDSLHNLGVIALAQGEGDKALAYLQGALEGEPARAAFWLSLLEAFLQLGRLPEAVELLDKGRQHGLNGDAVDKFERRLQLAREEAATTKRAADSSADRTRRNKAPLKRRKKSESPKVQKRRVARRQALMEAFNAGNLAEVDRLAQLLMRDDPSDALAPKVLGTALTLQGRNDEARAPLEQSLTLQPEQHDALCSLGKVLLEQGQPHEAIEYLRRSLALRPDYLLALNNLGNALRQLNRPSEALRYFRRAVELQPDYADALAKMGLAYKELEQDAEARDTLERAHQLDPDKLEVMNNLGVVLSELGEPERALYYLNRVLQRNPDHVSALVNLAAVYQALGRSSERVQVLQRARRLAPDHVKVIYSLTPLHHFDIADPAIDHLEKMLASPDAPRDEREQAGFALGKICVDHGHYDRAWSAYQRANALVAERRDIHAHRAASVENLTQDWGEALYQQPPLEGLDTRLPVFVTGLPRSGKSLVEQLLASHPAVHAGGERSLKLLDLPSLRSPAMEASSLQALSQRARTLLDELVEMAPAGVNHVINTSPASLVRLGAIGLVFPRAPIVLCRRDPRDLALACYFKHFLRGHGYTYHLDSLWAEIQAAEQIMAHWARVLPNPVLEVRYEHMVSEPHAVARDLWGLLELSGDPAPLNEWLDAGSDEGLPDGSTLGPADSMDAQVPITDRFVGLHRQFPGIQPPG